VEQLRQLIGFLGSRKVNPTAHREAVIQFRKLLAHHDIHPYLDRIVEAGVIPCFTELLDPVNAHEIEPQLQVRFMSSKIIYHCQIL
jgi:hypothetical protein